jgi:hypothetical protein
MRKPFRLDPRSVQSIFSGDIKKLRSTLRQLSVGVMELDGFFKTLRKKSISRDDPSQFETAYSAPVDKVLHK